MILADTSVWIDHLHRSREDLLEQLMQGRVLSHPFVIGEMACGRMRDREVVLAALRSLPAAKPASHEEALALLEGRRLHGRGQVPRRAFRRAGGPGRAPAQSPRTGLRRLL